MRDIERAITVLIRDTAVENDEAELARLRNLPPEEQLEVGMVLHEAMRQATTVPNGYVNERLLRVRSVAAAQQYLLAPEVSAPVLIHYSRLSGEVW
jgi:outer membrane protein TolC